MAEIRINATGGVKLYDADDSHYAQIIAGTITSNTDVMTLGHNVIDIPMTTASSSATTGALTIGGGLGVAADLYIGDDTYLITDSAVLGFGADKDTTLTHTDGTGLTLNSTNKLCFNDTSQFVQGISATVLGLGATDEIDLTATAVDLNGTLDVSGQATFADGTAGAPSISNTGDTNCGIFFSAADTIAFSAAGTSQVTISDGAILPVTDDDIDIGASGTQFKNAYFDGTLEADAITIGGTTVNAGSLGKVLQVIRATTTTTTTTSSTSMVDITNLTVNITPASTSNKVFVIMNVNGITSEASNISGCSLRIYQASDVSGEAINMGYGSTNQLNQSATLTALESPSSTSELTYKGQCRNRVAANVSVNIASDTSSITVMEIAG